MNKADAVEFDVDIDSLIRSGFQPCLVALTSGETLSPDDCAAYVASHPFFTISQKSHELFHSGMLAWMMKIHPSFAAAILDEEWMSKERQLRVETEIGRRDITIWDGVTENCYVIENKFKSFYSPDQLSEYARNLTEGDGVTFKKGIVLGLIEDVDDKRLQNPWEYRSYYRLLERLKQAFDGLEKSGGLKGRDCFIVEQYLEFLDAILSLLSPFRKNLGESVWGADFAKAYRDLGILEFVKKMQAHAFAEYTMSKWVGGLLRKYVTVEIATPYTYGGEAEVQYDIYSLKRSLPTPKVQIQIILRGAEIVRRVKIVGRRKSLDALLSWNNGKKLRRERVYQYLEPIEIAKRNFSSVSKRLKEELEKAIDIMPKVLCEMGGAPQCRVLKEIRR